MSKKLLFLLSFLFLSCTSINLGCTDPSFSDFDPDANIEVFTGGPTSLNEYGAGGYHYNDSWDMIFNVLEDTYLSSIDVNAQNSGSITLDIISVNGSVFAQFDYNLNPGWNTLSIETLIPQGDNYTIGVTGNNQSIGLYRNNAVPNGIFPIEIADRITIIGNTTDSPESYFYYFYNWTIDASCSGSLTNQNLLVKNILIYPNPTSDYLFIDYNEELEAKVYNLNGKLILSEYIIEKLDISCLKKGYYIVKFSDGSNELIHKIIKD